MWNDTIKFILIIVLLLSAIITSYKIGAIKAKGEYVDTNYKGNLFNLVVYIVIVGVLVI